MKKIQGEISGTNLEGINPDPSRKFLYLISPRDIGKGGSYTETTRSFG